NNDILQILSDSNGQQQFEGVTKPNSEALSEIQQYLNMQEIKHLPTSMGDMHKRFSGIPYGWREVDIAALIAELVADKKISVKYSGAMILASDRKMPDYLRKRTVIDKVIIQKKGEISQIILKNAREFLREYFDIMDIPVDGDDVVVFVIDKFEEQKKLLSNMIAKEYSVRNYPDKKLIEEGIALCNDLLSQKRDGLLLLKKMNELADDFLDFNEDMGKVNAFFKNQRIIFDQAFDKLRDIEIEKEYFQNEQNALAIIYAIKEILSMQKPYKRINELPDLLHDIQDIYNHLLTEKREEVLSDIRAAMAEIHQTANIQQSEIVERADVALTAKRDSANTTANLIALDAMKIQIANLRQQYMRQLVTVQSDKKITTASRASICHTAQIKSEEDIEQYLEQVRKVLKNKLSGNDILHII
ncbi:MAG: hypothetical protein K2H93_05675, partial [Oscillospiraceae bacterium]|nr:hypothetical protein [Oscillospiraceae bacterium]